MLGLGGERGVILCECDCWVKCHGRINPEAMISICFIG